MGGSSLPEIIPRLLPVNWDPLGAPPPHSTATRCFALFHVLLISVPRRPVASVAIPLLSSLSTLQDSRRIGRRAFLGPSTRGCAQNSASLPTASGQGSTVPPVCSKRDCSRGGKVACSWLGEGEERAAFTLKSCLLKTAFYLFNFKWPHLCLAVIFCPLFCPGIPMFLPPGP